MSTGLSAIVPVFNAGDALARTLQSVSPYVNETIVVDGGSTDGAPEKAKREGAILLQAPKGRGAQLAAGADAAGGDWLLFIHADTQLAPGWRDCVERFQAAPALRSQAAYFQLAFDDSAAAARRTAAIANWRARRFGLPYGDQGLVISKAFYRALGGYNPLPLMEDVDFARRVGRKRLVALDAVAMTSADKYRKQGWTRRSARNLICLTLYFMGVSPRRIARLYG